MVPAVAVTELTVARAAAVVAALGSGEGGATKPPGPPAEPGVVLGVADSELVMLVLLGSASMLLGGHQQTGARPLMSRDTSLMLP